tara:strand:- start:387 stop:665 length:279 start_codon:yes stop_codon:yes gene_type:complete
MKSKTNCWNCKIIQQNNELHNKDYLTLKEIADEIGLSYYIVADISSGRKTSKNYSKFIYQPIIKISRIKTNDLEDLNDLKETNENLENEATS